ncbi:c-type cytochrome biogenesis protein CcmI [Silicimonas algicola]|uniref:Cytochrome c-type biogenesis protein CcmH n=1 Tax=Silicimonas algicola TaxID=1826607 RepID=A0A316GBY0_9RHOB|nr:c-type cytochrome biogenesis protein CcmI [Silicimonas algicola]AZQ67461.1 c-type cytochrome biogenesis protein CcmI [Silicimonas algicola]PWK57150.1 cytochrome c-type biogenesis protein CcmH [Silicimonas algicola]
MFWIVAGLIVAAVAASLLASLRVRGAGLSGGASDLAVYRDQLTEIERDLSRGVLRPAEAEAARTEVSRRLLDADARATAASAAKDGARLPAALLMIAVLLLGAGGLYALIGAPGTRDLPMEARLAAIQEAAAARPGQAEAEALAAPTLPAAPEPDANFLDLMEKLRAALETRPNDAQGLALLAQNEARLGNFTAAREAQEKLIAAKGEDATADDLSMLVDMMVFAAGGYVSPEAEARLRRLTDLDPENGAGQYYAGLMLAQNGRPDRAFPIWRRLLETGAPDAPWVPVIRAEIEGLAAAAGVDYAVPAERGPTSADVEAAADMTDEDRQAMIGGMVEGLAERLATQGGPPEDWARLIGALAVLGESERASAIAVEARNAFAGNDEALAIIAAAASRAGVAE